MGRLAATAVAADRLLLAVLPGVKMILLVLVLGTLWLATDRAPPFALLKSEYPPPVVAPGAYVALRADVRRDIERDCSAVMSRHIHFADARRVELPVAQFSAHELAAQELRAPGRMAPVVLVPAWAPDGRADMIATLRYRCGRNPWHWPFPIEVVISLPFIVQGPPAAAEALPLQ
jgi:hypothetical protein